MPQELPDESDNQGLKMKQSKTMMMMETDTPTYINNTQIENVDTASDTKTKTRRFKEKSRPDGQHSTSIAKLSRVT